MKTTSLLLAFSIGTGAAFLPAGEAGAQSQRLVFVEEFTQASCGPCASANPSFNALLSANTTKAVSVKYQVSWPGTDPMNAQNPGEVATRVSYYGVSGVPDAYMDGNVYAGGAPSGITQTSINNEYAVASPFSIDLKHWFNAANDSIFINCEVTASQNTTLTTGKLHVVMIEKTISFASPPGSNGEKDFYNVFRKAYPNMGGTSLVASWTTGQKKTVSFKAPIPAYIYQKPQIAVVAWIQDDANKNVKQSAYSPTASTPLALAPVADFMTPVAASCDGIYKFYDQSALFPTSWSWDFGDGTYSSLQNPVKKYNASGTYAVKLTATNANGSNSITKSGYVTVTLSGTAPTGVSDNFCNSGTVNLSAAPAGSGTLNWYNAAGAVVNTGTTYNPTLSATTNYWVAEMTANAVKAEGEADNTMGAGGTYTANATQGLIFDVVKACKLISVKTYASTAGNRTIQVVDQGGNIVQTATVNIPSGLSTVTLNFNLDPGTGYTIRPNNTCNLYRNTAGAVYPYNASGVVSITGNTASNAAYYYFFYDWQVQQNPCASPSTMVSGIDSCSVTAVNNLEVNSSLAVFPNPGSGVFNVSFSSAAADNYTVSISNTLGQTVYTETLAGFSGVYSKTLDIARYGKGVYMLTVSGSSGHVAKNIITQ